MNIKCVFTIFFSIIMLNLFASDVTIYVSPEGIGKGNKKNAPTSLENAIVMIGNFKKTNLKGTISIVLMDGIYEISKPIHITNETGGSSDLKIIFKAANKAKPVISGGRKVALKGDKILSADISGLLNEYSIIPHDIYCNGKRAVRAKTPNNALPNFIGTSQIMVSNNQGEEKSIQCYEIPSEITNELSKLTDEQLKKSRFVSYHKWDNTIRNIDSIDIYKNKFYSTGTAWKPWNIIDANSTFFIENFLAALDSDNEWFLDGTVLKFIPENDKIKQVEIIVPVVENLLVIEGSPYDEVSNITIDGISFSYSNNTFHSFEPRQAAANIDAAVMLDYANNINFINCEIKHTGQYGIWLRNKVKKCEINSCLISDLGAGGVRIGECSLPLDTTNYTSSNAIKNSIIQSGGYNYPSAVGVFIAHSAKNIVTHNDIGDFRYTGVSVGWVWGYDYSPAINNKITYNHIHHIGWGVLSDMAAVYTLGKSLGTEVSNNIIHDVYSYGYGGWGLYTDEGSSDILMENNLVYNTKTGGFHQHYGKDNIIRNNILAFSLKYQAQYTRVEKHRSFNFKSNIIITDTGVMFHGPWADGDVVLDNNLYWGMGNKAVTFTLPYNKEKGADSTLIDWQRSSRKDQNSIFANPEFVDAKQRNFKLKNDLVVKRIGFKIFTIDEAGVKGDTKWKKKSNLPKEIVNKFEESVRNFMKL